MERAQRQSPADKHSSILAKVSAAEERRGQLMQKQLERLADHNKKVMERRRTLSSEMHDSRKSLCLQIESKLQSAAEKREELLKQVQEKASIKKASPVQTESSKLA